MTDIRRTWLVVAIALLSVTRPSRGVAEVAPPAAQGEREGALGEAPPAGESASDAADEEDAEDAGPAAEDDATTSEAGGEAPPPRRVEIGGEVAVASTYVFRGVLQYGSTSIPSFQPSLYVDFSSLLPGSLRFDLWSAFAMVKRERVSRQGSASEVDLSLTYEIALARDWIELGVGFLYYLYPGEERVDGEKEFILSLGVGNLPLSIGVDLWFNVHPGFLLTIEPHLGWEQSFGDFTVGFNLVLGAHVGQEGDSGVDYTTFTFGVSHGVGRLTVGASLSYSLQIAPPGLDFLERSILHGAVSVGYGG